MNEPIRILHVFARLNRGGAETMIMNLYRNIDRTKIQFDFIVHTEEECTFDKEIEKLGGNIYRVPRYVGKNHFAYKNAWKDFFSNHPEYRIIHGHVRSTASIYLKIAQDYDLITIAHSHSTSSGVGISALVKNFYQRSVKHSANYLFACSLEAGIWLYGKAAVKGKDFFVLKNAIMLDKYKTNNEVRKIKRDELNLSNKIVIGHVGRFNEPKNHKFIIEIFSELSKVDDRYVLLLIGDGNLKSVIEKKVTEYNLENRVVFTGVRSDVSELMKTMDVFIFPSLYEGLGIALIEAQATGLKCFTSDSIPQEAILTENVHRIPLKAPINEWVDHIVTAANQLSKNRKDRILELKNAGYDIRDSSQWLEKFYLEVSKRYAEEN